MLIYIYIYIYVRQTKSAIYTSGHRGTRQRSAAEGSDKAEHASVGKVFVSLIAKLLVYNV
jgi:hypothetical protein